MLWRGGYLYFDAREKYERLNAPFHKAEELRKRHAELERQVQDARTAAEDMRDVADEAQDAMDTHPDDQAADAAWDDVMDMSTQAALLEKALEDLKARALAAEAEATEAERVVAQLSPSAQQERDYALTDLISSDLPSPADRTRGRAVYQRWQEMNPLKT